MTASSDPPSRSKERSPAADALNTLATTVVIGCLSVAALAIGWVGLEMLGNSGWERLIAFIGLSVAGLACWQYSPMY